MDSGQLSSVVLSAATTQLLVRHQAVVAEILRHFWTCFPVISPALEQKVGGTFWNIFYAFLYPGASHGAMFGAIQGRAASSSSC